MESLVTEYVTVVPLANKWRAETRVVQPAQSGPSFIARLKRVPELEFLSREQAEHWAETLARGKGVVFVPSECNVLVAGPLVKSIVPMEITNEGKLIPLNGEKGSNSLPVTARRIRELAREKGLPYALPLEDSDSSDEEFSNSASDDGW